MAAALGGAAIYSPYEELHNPELVVGIDLQSTECLVEKIMTELAQREILR
jgi:hypothetical protein